MARTNSKCTECGRRADGEGRLVGLCDPCYDYAGWENTHTDFGHNEILAIAAEQRTAEQIEEIKNCPVCAGTEPTGPETRTGHRSPRRPQLNHRRDCSHPQTARARRACRKAHWAAQASK